MPWSQFDKQQLATSETYRAIIEGVPAMLWLGDAAGRCLFLNRAQREFWGVSNESISQFDWSMTVHPDDAEQLQRAFVTAMSKHESFEIEARYKRSDGVYRVLHTSARPRFSESGHFLGMSGVNTDVTEQRASEERVEVLTNELSHRMKNLFAVIGALMSITRRENPEAAPAFDELTGRLHAVSSSYQETLELAGLPSSKPLNELVERVLAPYQQGNRISIKGVDIRLSARGTSGLALILNELATNSAKYGSLSDTGRLEISAELEDGDLKVIWREFGSPKDEANPGGAGFGSQLLDFTAQDIGARLTRDWVDGALRICITIPHAALEPDVHGLEYC